jgi:alpha-glucosidase
MTPRIARFGSGKQLRHGVAIVLCSLLAPGWVHAFQKGAEGIELQVGEAAVDLKAVTPTAFCLSIAYQGEPGIAGTTFLSPEAKNQQVPWKTVQEPPFVGIQSSAGELLINPQNGRWMLKNPGGATVIPESALGGKSPFAAPDQSTAPGLDIPLAWTGPAAPAVYGSGNGVPHLQQSDVHTHLDNGVAVIPYYWSPGGYAALAVTNKDNNPAYWTAAADHGSIAWHFPGTTADLYLMPAPTLRAACQAYAQLTGFAPVPPRWSFGYLQSRWGWQDRKYIEDTLQGFRSRHIPVDAFIFDFEWYTPEPDYKVPPQGIPGFTDFGWNPKLFPQPVDQLKDYLSQGIHFVGIRKPRLGNSASLALLRAKDWMLVLPPDLKKPATDRLFQKREVNFADPGLRDWYAAQSQDLLRADIAGWWNDEGESTFTSYYDWNEAELAALNQGKPGQRLWTINRAFSPGVQRLGAAAWTGDIAPEWNVLARTPTDLLNWSLAGMPYGACDIGGFKGATTPELLSRWMEAGVFFPVMRTHSQLKVTPHFPWLFGPDALTAIKKAIELRYRLIPYYYSLAHEAHETGVPVMRPLAMEFPGDARVADLSDQWLMGRSVMAAPILQQGAESRSVYLPGDGWFRFENGTPLPGGQTLTVSARLDEIPVFIRAGTILPLSPVIQSTSQLPGGPLDLQIYPGKDATFTLVEDDGQTTAYLKGAFRQTIFSWDDAAGKLSWTTAGSYDGPDRFRRIMASLFTPNGVQIARAVLGPSGSVLIRPTLGRPSSAGSE